MNKGIPHMVRHSPGWTLINDLLVSGECKAWVVHLSHLDLSLREKSSSRQSCKTQILKTQWPNSLCYLREWPWTTACIIPVWMQKKPSINNQKWVLFFIHSGKVVAEFFWMGETFIQRWIFFSVFLGSKFQVEEIIIMTIKEKIVLWSAPFFFLFSFVLPFILLPPPQLFF